LLLIPPFLFGIPNGFKNDSFCHVHVAIFIYLALTCQAEKYAYIVMYVRVLNGISNSRAYLSLFHEYHSKISYTGVEWILSIEIPTIFIQLLLLNHQICMGKEMTNKTILKCDIQFDG